MTRLQARTLETECSKAYLDAQYKSGSVYHERKARENAETMAKENWVVARIAIFGFAIIALMAAVS